MTKQGRYARRRKLDMILREANRQQQAQVKQQVARVAASMATTTARRSIRIGVGTAPLLVVGGTAPVPIVWSSPFPTADYAIDISGFPNLLGRATLTLAPGTKTAEGLTVNVTASLAVSLGSQFIVVAYC